MIELAADSIRTIRTIGILGAGRVGAALAIVAIPLRKYRDLGPAHFTGRPSSTS